MFTASPRWPDRSLVLLHMALLFFDPYAQLRFVDFVVPFLGAYRPLWQGLGTLAFDLLVVVVADQSAAPPAWACGRFASSTGSPMRCGRSRWRTRSATEPTPTAGGSWRSPVAVR